MSDFLLAHNTPNRNNASGSVGCRFTVATAVLITKVGRFYDAGSTHDHVISIWISTNTTTPLARATVLASSASDGNGYKWAPLPASVILRPGNTYSIAVDEANGLDNWPDIYVPTVDANFTITQGCFVLTPSLFPSSNSNAGSTFSTPNMEDVSQTVTGSVIPLVIQESMSMSDKLTGIGYGLLPNDQMTQSDSFLGVAPLTLNLSDSLNNWADSFAKNVAIAKAFADSLNFWADGTAGGSIGLGARVSQVEVEVLVAGSPRALVSQVMVEVLVSRQSKQPRIVVNT